MKINLLLSIVFSLSFVSVVDIYAAPLDSKLQDAGAATETKESLIVKIKSKKIVERLDAIHKLAKINNEDSIIVIMEHFKLGRWGCFGSKRRRESELKAQEPRKGEGSSTGLRGQAGFPKFGRNVTISAMVLSV